MGETIVHARVRHLGRRDHDPAHPAQVGSRARVEGRDATLELLLELDLGTENLGRLEEKMERYEILAGAATAPDVVLFCFPSAAREASARVVLGGTPMPVATATLDRHLADPFGAIWLPLDGDRRVRLLNLRRRDE